MLGIATAAAWVTTVAWLQSLAQELLYAIGAAITKKKKRKLAGGGAMKKMNVLRKFEISFHLVSVTVGTEVLEKGISS